MRKSKPEKPVAKELSDEEIKVLLHKIGQAMKKHRKKRRGSLDDFSYEIGVSRSAVARFETGGDMVLSNFLKVAYGLDIKLSDLFKELE